MPEATEVPAAVAADLQDERLIQHSGVGGSITAFRNRIKSGDLGSLPVIIGLVVIWIVFQLINPTFLSSINLVNLTLQCAAIGTIAIGVVLVLLLGEIDLSVGSVSGLSSAILAVGFVTLGWPLVIAIAASVLAGVVIGLLYGFLFTRFGVPSFVITLMSSPFKGRDADALYEYRGLFWRRPYLTAVLTVMMLSLAGIPLTAGFIGKFYIVATGVEAHEWWLVASLVLGSAIGVFYYLRVMVTLYLIEPNLRRVDAELHWEQKAGGVMLLAIALLAFFLGVYPQPLLTLVQHAVLGV